MALVYAEDIVDVKYVVTVFVVETVVFDAFARFRETPSRIP